MGLLVDGQWHDKWYDTRSSNGEFIREDAQFRNWISSEPESEFSAEPNRYHLYVSLACPWAHRVLIFRKLKQLDSYISVSTVQPDMLNNGWEYKRSATGQNSQTNANDILDYDPINHAHYHWQIYRAANSDYSGRVTVPVLWDKQKNTIVNNESSELIRMLNSEFNHLTGNTLDFYLEEHRPTIDSINERIYHEINNGVYKSGFATTQQAYEKNVVQLFKCLDWVEQILSEQRYLAGSVITEADWRLFTTLIRFDAVYVGHFKCNIRTIESYPNLSNYLRELYQYPGIAETVDFAHIKRHYYYSHDTINPTRVIPVGPEIDYLQPHNRAKVFA